MPFGIYQFLLRSLNFFECSVPWDFDLGDCHGYLLPRNEFDTAPFSNLEEQLSRKIS